MCVPGTSHPHPLLDLAVGISLLAAALTGKVNEEQTMCETDRQITGANTGQCVTLPIQHIQANMRYTMMPLNTVMTIQLVIDISAYSFNVFPIKTMW